MLGMKPDKIKKHLPRRRLKGVFIAYCLQINIFILLLLLSLLFWFGGAKVKRYSCCILRQLFCFRFCYTSAVKTIWCEYNVPIVVKASTIANLFRTRTKTHVLPSIAIDCHRLRTVYSILALLESKRYPSLALLVSSLNFARYYQQIEYIFYAKYWIRRLGAQPTPLLYTDLEPQRIKSYLKEHYLFIIFHLRKPTTTKTKHFPS